MVLKKFRYEGNLEVGKKAFFPHTLFTNCIFINKPLNMCEENLSVGGANLVFLTVKCRKWINASPSINKSTERHTRVPHYQSAIFHIIATTLQPPLLPEQLNIMMQRTANENAACLHRICKRSDQPKIERLVNNDARPCIIVYCYTAGVFPATARLFIG